jgi:hypothetical protein
MGTLERPDGSRTTLGSRTLVGRAVYCAIRLVDPMASAEHASIYHDGERWILRDLASTNGTFVDGVRIEGGRKVVLQESSTIGFGTPHRPWSFVSNRSPRVRAWCRETGVVSEPTGGLMVLPSEQSPLVTIYAHAQGWYEDREGTLAPLTDQAELLVDGSNWVFELPPPSGDIAETGLGSSDGWATFDSLRLRFRVSQDRESIALVLWSKSERRALASRAHHELLLVMAEAKLADRERGLSPEECGWLSADDLARRVAADPTKINVEVFRARQQFDQLGVLEAHRIVERRGSPRQLRLGLDAFEVEYGCLVL